jgi:hypothetical protein
MNLSNIILASGEPVQKRIRGNNLAASFEANHPPVFGVQFDQKQRHRKAGLLVVDCQRRITGLNRKLLDLWSLPCHLLVSRDDKLAQKLVSQHFEDPESFLTEIGEIYSHPNLIINDKIWRKDKKIFERYSHPLLESEKIVGRIWKFWELVQLGKNSPSG